jgi:hypothetical protein
VLRKKAQYESAPPLRAGRQAAACGRALPAQVADRVRRRPEALACRAQGRHQTAASAQREVSQPGAESWPAAVPGASPDGAAAEVRQPEVLAVAAVPRRGAEAVRDGMAAVRQPAARAAGVVLRQVEAVPDVVEAAVLPREAVQDEAERLREVVPGAAEAGRLREAPDVPAAAQPSAAPWVCRRGRLPPWLVQPRSAHPVHAMEVRRIVLP